jgi:hypothetical protein
MGWREKGTQISGSRLLEVHFRTVALRFRVPYLNWFQGFMTFVRISRPLG